MKDRVCAFLAVNGPSVGIVILIVAALIMLSGCGTIAGVGSDITKTAEWTRDKMTGSKNISNMGGSQ
jgi:predicted small secreted protein